jgi:hypothetical protein
MTMLKRLFRRGSARSSDKTAGVELIDRRVAAALVTFLPR